MAQESYHLAGMAQPVRRDWARRCAREKAVSRREGRLLYEAMVCELKDKYKIAVRRWHRRMCGVAYELKFSDGRIRRMIAAPRPRGPVSAAIFLHEVGHHAVGFHRYQPRCLEEYYAWQWAFREMSARGIPLRPGVLRHYRRSMYHYVRLARRPSKLAASGSASNIPGHAPGVKDLPAELQQFLHWPG